MRSIEELEKSILKHLNKAQAKNKEHENYARFGMFVVEDVDFEGLKKTIKRTIRIYKKAGDK